MGAEMIPFPAARRARLIRTTAASMADSCMAQGDRTLAHVIERQSASMRKKGFSAEIIAAEMRSFELAVRARLRSLWMMSGGTA